MDKKQTELWKNIGYEAQRVICLADDKSPIEAVKETVDIIRKQLRQMEISEIRRLQEENAIAVIDYVDMLMNAVAAHSGDYTEIRNCGNAVLQIVVDMSYGKLKEDGYYKKIAEEGVCCVQS